MKRDVTLRLLVPILVAVLAAPAHAGSNPLWRVDGGESTVWLLGSIHALRKSDYPLAQPIRDAFAQSEIVAVEADIGPGSRQALQQAMAEHGIIRGERRLEDYYSDGDWQQVRTRARELGHDLSMMQHVKPWVAALTIASAELQKAGYSPNSGVDRHFLDRARKTGKTVKALETIEYQLSLFSGMSEQMQATFLKQSLDEAADYGRELDKLVDEWKNGRSDAMARRLKEDFSEYPELYDALVVQRNKNWLPEIRQLAGGDKPALVVVGTLHLVGEDGLIPMLEDAGYTVVQE